MQHSQGRGSLAAQAALDNLASQFNAKFAIVDKKITDLEIDTSVRVGRIEKGIFNADKKAFVVDTILAHCQRLTDQSKSKINDLQGSVADGKTRLDAAAKGLGDNLASTAKLRESLAATKKQLESKPSKAEFDRALDETSWNALELGKAKADLEELGEKVTGMQIDISAARAGFYRLKHALDREGIRMEKTTEEVSRMQKLGVEVKSAGEMMEIHFEEAKQDQEQYRFEVEELRHECHVNRQEHNVDRLELKELRSLVEKQQEMVEKLQGMVEKLQSAADK